MNYVANLKNGGWADVENTLAELRPDVVRFDFQWSDTAYFYTRSQLEQSIDYHEFIEYEPRVECGAV